MSLSRGKSTQRRDARTPHAHGTSCPTNLSLKRLACSHPCSIVGLGGIEFGPSRLDFSLLALALLAPVAPSYRSPLFSCPTSPPSGTCARCTSLPYRRHSVGGSTEVSRRRYRIRARKLVHPSTHPLSVSRVRFCWHVVLLLLLLPQRQKVLPPLRSSEVVQYLTSRADLFPRSCPCSSSSSSPLSCR